MSFFINKSKLFIKNSSLIRNKNTYSIVKNNLYISNFKQLHNKISNFKKINNYSLLHSRCINKNNNNNNIKLENQTESLDNKTPSTNPNDIKDKDSNNAAPTPKKESYLQKFNATMKKYGKTGFILYWLFYFTTFACIYVLIRFKYINKASIIEKIKGTRFENLYNKVVTKIGENNTDIAIAYLINGPLEIIRVPLLLLLLRIMFKK